MSNPIRKSALSGYIARHTPFDYDAFIASNPSEDDFDRWNDYCLPIEYSSFEGEYKTLRSSCALFDGTPMMKYRFCGADAGAFLDRVFTAPVSHHPEMKAAYALLCNEDGYLMDDGIVMKLAADNYFLITTEIDLLPHFEKYNDFDDLIITDESELFSGLALQGPKSCMLLSEMGLDGVENLAPFELQFFKLGDHKFLVGRLGFTGDLGYEVWFENDAADTWISAFGAAEEKLNMQVPGYGLTAINLCRIEAAMIVPGWDTAGEFEDLVLERTPFELTLHWNVKLQDERDFVGKAALLKHKENGARFHMTGATVIGNPILDFGQSLYANIEGKRTRVGSLPSVAQNPVSKTWIGFASIGAEYRDLEDLYVVHNKQEFPCELTKLPFINLEQRKKVPADL